MITALVASNLGELRRKEAASLLVQCMLFDLATARHLRYVIVFLPQHRLLISSSAQAIVSLPTPL